MRAKGHGPPEHTFGFLLAHVLIVHGVLVPLDAAVVRRRWRPQGHPVRSSRWRCWRLVECHGCTGRARDSRLADGSHCAENDGEESTRMRANYTLFFPLLLLVSLVL